MPRILLWDIETFPAVVETWGTRMYDEQVIRVVKPWELASFAYKELGVNEIHVHTREGKKSDAELMKELHKALSSADMLIAHNGDRFDMRKARTRMLKAKLSPLRQIKTVDTLKVAKKQFAFTSNRLDDLADFLEVGRKIKTGGQDLWRACRENDAGAWELMRKYNAQDVVLLEKVFLELRPWASNLPNLATISGKPKACPVCGMEGKLQSRGFNFTKVNKFRRFQCRACGGWSAARVAEKVEKPRFVG